MAQEKGDSSERNLVEVLPVRHKPRWTGKKGPRAPADLRPETRAWWASVVREYPRLKGHHHRMLTAAAHFWERGEEAREVLKANGNTETDRLGSERVRPEAALERASMLAYARMIRELDLDIDPPPGERSGPPGIQSNR